MPLEFHRLRTYKFFQILTKFLVGCTKFSGTVELRDLPNTQFTYFATTRLNKLLSISLNVLPFSTHLTNPDHMTLTSSTIQYKLSNPLMNESSILPITLNFSPFSKSLNPQVISKSNSNSPKHPPILINTLNLNKTNNNLNNKIKSLNLNSNPIVLSQQHQIEVNSCPFKVIYLNIRSINKNLDELQALLLKYDVLPDVISISETWLSNTSYFKPDIPGYHYINGQLNRKVGGVGFFVKEHIKYKIIQKFSLNLGECEDLWLELQNPIGANILLATIYRHPNPV